MSPEQIKFPKHQSLKQIFVQHEFNQSLYLTYSY